MTYCYWVAKEKERYNKIKKKFILSFFVVAMIVITGLLLMAMSSDFSKSFQGVSNNNTLHMERHIPRVERYNFETGQLERVNGR